MRKIPAVLLMGLLAACRSSGSDDNNNTPDGSMGSMDMTITTTPDGTVPTTPDGTVPTTPDGSADMNTVPLRDGAVDGTRPARDAAVAVTGDQCGSAVTLTAGVPTNGSIIGAALDYSFDDEEGDSKPGCAGSSSSSPGPDATFRFVIPAGQRATVALNPHWVDDADLTLNLVAGPSSACNTFTQCLTSADRGYTGDSEAVAYVNSSGSDLEVFAIVSGYSSGTDEFDITLTLSTPPAGDVCGSATSLSASVTGQSLSTFENDYISGSGTNCRFGSGRDRVYSISVPAGQRVTARIAPTGFDPTLTFIQDTSACSSLTCLSGVDSGSGDDPEVLAWSNSTGSTATVLLVVDAYSASSTTLDYDLEITVATPPAGDVCTSAGAASGTLTGQTLLGFGNDYQSPPSGSLCRFGTGFDRAYSVSVPAGQRLTATVTPDSSDTTTSFDPIVSIVADAASCGTGTCLGGAQNASTGSAESAMWFNAGSSAASVIVVVDSARTVDNMGFSLALSSAAPPAGDVCGSAEVIAGATTTTGTTAGFGNDYGTGTMCSGTAGADRVYSIAVNPGKTLVAQVTSTTDMFDPSVSIVATDACSVTPRVCLASDDTGTSTTVNTARWQNTGSSPVTVNIVIDSFSSSRTGTYELATSFE